MKSLTRDIDSLHVDGFDRLLADGCLRVSCGAVIATGIVEPLGMEGEGFDGEFHRHFVSMGALLAAAYGWLC